MFKRILLATDGSSASDHAAMLAISLARTHGAKLTALYVVDPYPYLGIGEANPMGFNAYMAGPKGQLIFLKSGLLPATQNIRIQSIKQ